MKTLNLLKILHSQNALASKNTPDWWYTFAVLKAKPSKKRKKVELTSAQVEIAGQFGDYSFENPKMTFKEVVRREFGPKLFSRTPNGKRFEKICRTVFDKEREA